MAVDALRGFAVMGIVLLHNIEHFNFYSFPPPATGLLGWFDTHIWDTLFFLFSGKAYAIFALLFGFTFYLQSRSSEKRGEDFKNRYMWRLLLLLGFGFINASFFPGEILVLYAILGFVLVPVRHWSNKAVFILALFLMLQPLEWVKVICAVVNPEFAPKQMIYSLGDVYPQLGGTSWWGDGKGKLCNRAVGKSELGLVLRARIPDFIAFYVRNVAGPHGIFQCICSGKPCHGLVRSGVAFCTSASLRRL